ncbi:hypothetical protein EVAR_96593_1 [Eumeta japonica]|uniref:Uncharacterized protein n=1 Tax=Eumeta variegata TaxID=151549 RepID=A0A4C1WUX7_EUMVA|nr:hypothetical protein EVAR_96593_1 [Eumeta japonica]
MTGLIRNHSDRRRWEERRFYDWGEPAAEWNGGRVHRSMPPLDAHDYGRRRRYRHSPSPSESPSRSRSRTPTPVADWSDVEGALRRRAPRGGSSRAWSGRSETAATEATLKEEASI